MLLLKTFIEKVCFFIFFEQYEYNNSVLGYIYKLTILQVYFKNIIFFITNYLINRLIKKHLSLLLLSFIIISELFNSSIAVAQIGGKSVYHFLNLPTNARQASMGGVVYARYDNDIQLSLYNPSLLSPETHNQLCLDFTDHFSDIKQGYAGYSRTFKKLGSFQAGFQFLNYGKFTETTDADVVLGDFTANDLALNIGWGRRLDSSFSIGSNLKFISSQLQDYYSFGIATDIAATYINNKHRLAVSLIARNIGRQLVTYTKIREPLPFEIQLGFSQKLKNAPFTYSIVVQNLEKWDLTYNDPNDPEIERDAITNEIKEKSKASKIFDKTMRHLVFGLEFQPFKAFALRLSYNYKRRQEVSVPTSSRLSGFAWGFGIKISKFQISYARDIYHPAGAPNYFTIATNLSDFAKK